MLSEQPPRRHTWSGDGVGDEAKAVRNVAEIGGSGTAPPAGSTTAELLRQGRVTRQTMIRDLTERSAEGWLFCTEALRGFRTTGAIAPSGKRLAAMLAEPLRQQAGRPLDVLEVGAGTGSVTRALISLLGRESRLDVVEANARFAASLRHLVHTCPASAGETGRVRVHEEFIEHLHTGRTYDVIVSGLPFTNFTPDRVEAIMEQYLKLLRPGGTLTYFAYTGTGLARALLASRGEAARHLSVESILAGYQRRYGTACRTVWRNLPPARVWQLRAPTTSRAGTAP